ncbi:hypothetical protein BSL78_02974 [Apostichopus japonicus]|uniref:Uncharacterized protein n=1 Tax=Stichopus japonicus TaxID=307972 RepID=A0A2G8LIJ4_STIJA|nr:hypothetical protein BSL78_02974 [Apostichopus japonicus]
MDGQSRPWTKKERREGCPCDLCPGKYFKAVWELKRHLRHFHIDKGIKVGNVLTVPCKRNCITKSKTCNIPECHYHCYLCEGVLNRRVDFAHHASICQGNANRYNSLPGCKSDTKGGNSSDSGNGDEAGGNSQSVGSYENLSSEVRSGDSDDNQEEEFIQEEERENRRVSYNSGEEYRGDIDSEYSISSEVAGSGISDAGGNENVSSEGRSGDSDDNQEEEFIQEEERENRRVSYNSGEEYQGDVDSEHGSDVAGSDISDVGDAGGYENVSSEGRSGDSDDTREEEYVGKSRYQHFSVFNNAIDYYARLGRCVVTFDKDGTVLNCACCKQSRSCVHKGMCIWYLKECDLLPTIELEEHENLIEMLDRLEKGLECSVALGRHTELINKQLDINVRPQNVINSLLHFQALCTRSYHFHCVLCGYHPEIVILDIDKKGAFRCDVSNLELPSESEENDTVDCEQFWEDVQKNVLALGLMGHSQINPYDISPSYTYWSPYIGSNTRKGRTILNTEHRKIHRGNGLLENDAREFTQERLIEILHGSNVAYIKQVGRDVGIRGTSKMSKLDIIRKIRDTLIKDNSKFNKVFAKLQGSTGGWGSMVCPHGVVYAAKFLLRAESPRDVIDLIKSMKYLPNVVIVDMALWLLRMVTRDSLECSVRITGCSPHRQ